MPRLFLMLLLLFPLVLTSSSFAQDTDSPECDDVEAIVAGLQTLLDNVNDIEDLASISLAKATKHILQSCLSFYAFPPIITFPFNNIYLRELPTFTSNYQPCQPQDEVHELLALLL